MEINKKSLSNLQIKTIDETNFTVEAIVSNNSLDADREIILDSAWKNFKRYKANPVFIAGHDIYSLGKVIGKCLSIKKTGQGVECKFQYFVGQGNDDADWAFMLAKEKLAAFSVGFIVKEIEFDTGKISGLLKKENIELKENDRLRAVITNAELYEISQVAVGSNKDALMKNKMLKDANIDIEKLYDDILKEIENIYVNIDKDVDADKKEVDKDIKEVDIRIELKDIVELVTEKTFKLYKEKLDTLYENQTKSIEDIINKKNKDDDLYKGLFSELDNYKID